jgi:hypothetical protein
MEGVQMREQKIIKEIGKVWEEFIQFRIETSGGPC